MLSCLGFRCLSSLHSSEKLRYSPRDRLFCVNVERNAVALDLCLSQAAGGTGGREGAAQGHRSGPTLKMGKTEAQCLPWSPHLAQAELGLTGGSPVLWASPSRTASPGNC